MTSKIKISAVLLAAGEGRRLRNAQPKALVNFRGKALFLHSLETLESHAQVDEIILVVPKGKVSAVNTALKHGVNDSKRGVKLRVNFKKLIKIISGGVTRQQSLEHGLRFARGKFVLIQNAANPLVTSREISAVVRAAEKCGAAAVGHASTATTKKIRGGKIIATLNRTQIWFTETPQIVRRDLLIKGLKIARQAKIEITDDVQLAELAGSTPKIVAASECNRKITTAADLAALESPSSESERRVGLGQDSHPFDPEKKPLILAGVKISPTGGLAGNSDGDVVLHALTNAISSALGGGSLSTFADQMCRRGISDSRKYLAVILVKMRAQNFQIENIAIAIEGSRPKLEKHFPKMRQSLTTILPLARSQIGITATSGEALTAFGRGEGLQCFALILLRR